MFYTLLTNIGKAKLANATALGTTVQLTHIAVGDGNGAAITPIDTATLLTHEVWRAALNSIAVDPANTNWIVAEGYIPSTSGGFTVREVGLFDIDGDLIAIGNYPDTYKPTLASGSAKDLYIKVIIEVTNSSTVTLKIDPAVVLSTRSYADSKVVEHEAKADPHSQYLTAAKINSAVAEDPGDTDLLGYYDSFTGLFRKLSFNSLFAWMKIKFDPIYTAPSGKINYFAGNTAPSGYLKANGAAISRTTYSDLFAAIGTTFGTGDGATTFNVPDLRGEFLRGYDDSRGVDSGRIFGSAQVDDFKSHTHLRPAIGSNLGSSSGDWYSANTALNNTATSATGGSETRPRNIALLACIKY